jgi:hypothetical protein
MSAPVVIVTQPGATVTIAQPAPPASVKISPPASTNVVKIDSRSAQGIRGLSAYQVAVLEGFVGTVQNWLDSLVGVDGDSAYQVAVNNGFVGSEAAWLSSLVGADGADGSSDTAAQVLAKLVTVDGAGSGLDADTLDGHDTGYFATAAGLSAHVADTGNPHGTTKAQVGLGNADNTSDANKPVSTAQAAADTAVTAAAAAALAGHVAAGDPHPGYALESTIGAAGGIAPLDGSSKIASAYLPSYVDDVLEYANYAALPGTGATGIIYITLDTNFQYRWTGTVYSQLTASPGTTDDVPEGVTNLYFTVARVRATVLTGLSLATNAAITAADTVLSAFGKLQKQTTDLIAVVAAKLATASNGLTASGTDVKLGGTLTADTVVDNNGHLLSLGNSVTDNLSWPTTLGIGIYVDPTPGAPIFGGPTNFNFYQYAASDFRYTGTFSNGLGAFLTTYNSATISISNYRTYGTIGSYASPTGSRLVYMGGEQTISGDTYAEFYLDCIAADSYVATWKATGEWRWFDFLNSRNNLAASTPINFLYTDASGNMKSGALNSSITRTALGLDSYISSASNGLTETTGDVKLGGALTVDTYVDTAGKVLRLGTEGLGGYPVTYPGVEGASVILEPSLLFAGIIANKGTPTDLFSASMESNAGGSAISYGWNHWNGSSYDRAGLWQGYDGSGGAYVLYAYGIYGGQFADMTLDMSGATPAWVFTADLKFNDYANSRNNLAASTPINFLYTDASGNMKSGALNNSITRTALGLGASNGLTESGGNVKLGGTLTAGTDVGLASNRLRFYNGNTIDYGTLYSAGAEVRIEGLTTNPWAGFGIVKQQAVNDRRRSVIYAEADQFFMFHQRFTNDANNDDVGTYGQIGGFGDSIYGTGQHVVDFVGGNATVFCNLYLDIGASTGTWTSENEDWKFTLYPNSRNNLAASTPVNFLYTDASGNMKSGALDSDIFRTAIGLDASNGTAEIDFGAFPGSNEGSVTVTGQTIITADKNIQLTVSCETSADYTAEDMAWIAALVGLSAGNIVDTTSFTIYARSLEQMQGKIKINWAY